MHPRDYSTRLLFILSFISVDLLADSITLPDTMRSTASYFKRFPINVIAMEHMLPGSACGSVSVAHTRETFDGFAILFADRDE